MEDHNVRALSQDMPTVSSAKAPEDASKPPKRRRRVPIACANCRLRKTKCEHIVPKNEPSKSSRGQSVAAYDYIRSLENKVKQYEAQLKEHQNNYNYETNYRAASNAAPGPLPAPTLQDGQPPSSLSHSITRPPLASDRGPAVITAATPSLFLGGDGAVSFTQLILNAMNPDSPDKVQSSTQLFSSPRDPSREMPDAKLYDLPPDARELVQRYLDYHHVLTPIFHLPTIFPQFEHVLLMDRSRRHEKPYTLAIINMICAISAAHRRNGVETSTVQTRKFYDRAMTLVGPTLFFDWSIEKVQVLLLGARYLQSSNFPDESWTILGLAIRIAQGLELHRPPPEHLDCITKEVRKRLWYACYATDQLSSTIYGRPVATASSTFSTPLPEDLDDERIQPSQLLYPSTPTISVMSYSIQCVQLYRIMESAAALVNPPLEKIVELDEMFEAWHAQVPTVLTIYEQESVQDDKRLIFAMRANMTRILIHRHSVVTSLGLLSRGERLVPPSDGLRANMMQNSRHICVRSAEETIQLVSRRHDRTKSATGPSWFNLYYLFNAILIIASHVVDPEFRDDKEALSHLEEGMRMIGQMSANHTTARRAHIFLRQLLDLVETVLPQQTWKSTRRASSSEISSSSLPPQTQPMVTTTAEGIPNNVLGYDGEAPREFVQLWGSTGDLTMALGSQLEFFSSVGSGMWSWGPQDARTYAANPPSIAP